MLGGGVDADGRAFREEHSVAIMDEFAQWVDNIAKGKSPIGFFKKLGELLQRTIGEMQTRPEQYANERSVLSVYLESGALGRHDDEALVGLLSMTLMAAVFNTQVSLAWILVHLYGDDELLQRARDEIATCPGIASPHWAPNPSALLPLAALAADMACSPPARPPLVLQTWAATQSLRSCPFSILASMRPCGCTRCKN